jgi:DNA-binding response OmpR family regulator
MTRVLVVDGSHLMCRLVEQLAPGRVLVEQVGSFSEAEDALTRTPPEAVIFNITPCHLRWRLLITLCQNHDPPIPFFCCTSLPENHDIILDLPCDREGIFFKPQPIDELRSCVQELLDRAPQIDLGSTIRQDQLQ